MTSKVIEGAGIIGAGIIFHKHARAYQALGVEIKMIADTDATRLSQVASQYSVKNTATDWRKLLENPSIEVVSICTPPNLHKEMIVECLKLHKHVICEKPLALSLKEADEILEAEKKYKGKLTVVHQNRFNLAYQRLKWIADHRILGKERSISCVRCDPPPDELIKKGVWGCWHSSGGGALMTKGIHHLDLLLWLFGKVKRVNATMGTYFFDIESEDQVLANLEFESGMVGSLYVSGNPYVECSEIFDCAGDLGRAMTTPWQLDLKDKEKLREISQTLDAQYPLSKKSRLDSFVSKVMKRLRGITENTKESMHERLIRKFLLSVNNETPVPVSAQEGRNAMEVCVAIYTSALRGEEVCLPLEKTSKFYNGISKEDYASGKATKAHS